MPIRRLIKKYPRCGCRDEVDMKEIRLYDYQAEMKERIEAAFRSYQSVMAQMPTGTGKTILLAEVVKSEERRVKNPDGEKSEKLKVITHSKLGFD